MHLLIDTEEEPEFLTAMRSQNPARFEKMKKHGLEEKIWGKASAGPQKPMVRERVP